MGGCASIAASRTTTLLCTTPEVSLRRSASEERIVVSEVGRVYYQALTLTVIWPSPDAVSQPASRNPWVVANGRSHRVAQAVAQPWRARVGDRRQRGTFRGGQTAPGYVEPTGASIRTVGGSSPGGAKARGKHPTRHSRQKIGPPLEEAPPGHVSCVTASG